MPEVDMVTDVQLEFLSLTKSSLTSEIHVNSKAM